MKSLDSREVEILIVEDNPNDAEMTIRALNTYNIANKLHLVEDGEQVLDFIFCRGIYADRDPGILPKIILLDLKLPKIDGLEVLKILKSDPKTKLIPVVILTASEEENDLIRSYKLGANSYIIKPVDFDKFVGVVKELGFYWMLLNSNPGLS